MRCLKVIGVAGCALTAVLLGSLREKASGQDSRFAVPLPPNPDGAFSKNLNSLDAGREAYARAETRRREGIVRQLQSIGEMLWYSGVPGYFRDPPSLGALYAYGSQRPLAARRLPGGGCYDVPQNPQANLFEPWPLVPGDIYGYPYLDRVDQPRGHEIIATGPNGYVYRPIYGRDLPAPPPPAARPASPKPESPQPIPPKPAEPAFAPPLVGGPEVIPAPPPTSGPREF
jgi:hypothetical protein